MQIRAIMRYHIIPTKMAILGGGQRKEDITSVGNDVKKFKPSYIAGGNIKWHNCYRKQLGSSSTTLHNYFMTQQFHS